MFRSVTSVCLLAIVLPCSAQSYVDQVLVLNEGYYDYFGEAGQLVPVTLGSYDPVTASYQTVATLVGPRFGSDVLVSEGVIYVAADDRVLWYDADTYAELGSVLVPGVRKLAVWEDALLLTRGELGGLQHYFEVRDKVGLELLHSMGPDEGLAYSAEDVLVLGNMAYLAVGNAFNWDDLQGQIGIVDLANMTYVGGVDLGPNGLNPEHLMLHDGDVIAFNNTDFSASSISRMSVGTGSLLYTTTVSVNSGCAASARVEANEQVYFLEYAQNELVRFDLNSGTVSDTLAGSPSVYGLIEDPVNGVLYATTTDFFSSGELHVLDLQGQLLSTVAVGVAPGSMALDVRSATGISDRRNPGLALYPNPSMDLITLTGTWLTSEAQVEVSDATGRVVLQQRLPSSAAIRLHVGGLKPGVYFLHLNGQRTLRFVKQ